MFNVSHIIELRENGSLNKSIVSKHVHAAMIIMFETSLFSNYVCNNSNFNKCTYVKNISHLTSDQEIVDKWFQFFSSSYK